MESIQITSFQIAWSSLHVRIKLLKQYPTNLKFSYSQLSAKMVRFPEPVTHATANAECMNKGQLNTLEEGMTPRVIGLVRVRQDHCAWEWDVPGSKRSQPIGYAVSTTMLGSVFRSFYLV